MESSDLKDLVVKSVTDEEHWEVIQQAKSRTKLGVGFIVDAIRDGRLRLAKFEGVESFSFGGEVFGHFYLRAEVDTFFATCEA